MCGDSCMPLSNILHNMKLRVGDCCYISHSKDWTFNMHAEVDQMYHQPAATFISEQLTGMYNTRMILPESSIFSGLI